jgi:hypothetical protein
VPLLSIIIEQTGIYFRGEFSNEDKSNLPLRVIEGNRTQTIRYAVNPGYSDS